VKFATRFFCGLAVVVHFFAPTRAEKDPVQRRYNCQILSYLLDPALLLSLLSDNIVAKTRKLI